jgi:hypothetical protein
LFIREEWTALPTLKELASAEDDVLETSPAPRQRQPLRGLRVPLPTRSRLIGVVQTERDGEGIESGEKLVTTSPGEVEGGGGLARMMDDDVVELGKVHGWEDAPGRASREGEMEDSDGDESETREEWGDSRRSRRSSLGEIV